MEKANLRYAFRRLGDWSTHKSAFGEAWEGVKDMAGKATGRATSLDENVPSLLIGSLSGKPAQSAGMNVAFSMAAIGVFSAVAYPVMAGVARVAIFIDDVRDGPPKAENHMPTL